MSTERNSPQPPQSERKDKERIIVGPPSARSVADSLCDSTVTKINKALDSEKDPVVVNAKGPHRSIDDLLKLIDGALDPKKK